MWFLRDDPSRYPPLDSTPTLTTAMLVVVLLGTLAAVTAPPPVLAQPPIRAREVADARAA
jgi:hypothetical protein